MSTETGAVRVAKSLDAMGVRVVFGVVGIPVVEVSVGGLEGI